MTEVATNGHGAHVEHASAPPPTGLRRFTAPGWWRVLWMMPLFWGIGAGIVLLLRWYAAWDPLWEWNALVVVAFLTTMPIGFLAGLGAFDYWVHYALGGETRPEDHSGHGARSWKDYFRVNTDHKVIGIQYLVTTFSFFVIGGLAAMVVRAELAKPGMQITDNQGFNGLFTVHATLMIFLFVIPAFAGLANYVVPLMLGAPDMAFPRLNALSFWLLPIGGLMLVGSFLAPGGPPAAGWTGYATLSTHLPMGTLVLQHGGAVGGRELDHDRAQLPRHDHHDACAGDDVLAYAACSCGRTSRPRCSSCWRRRSSPARSSS